VRFVRPDAVKFVVDALIAVRRAMVEDATTRSEIVVVASVVSPVAVNDDVAVIEPPVIVPLVSDAKKPVMPVMRLAKKLVLVALVVLKLVIVPVAEVSDEMVVVASVEVPVTPSVVPTTTAPDVVSAVEDARPSTV
jgi:hypothetical protein